MISDRGGRTIARLAMAGIAVALVCGSAHAQGADSTAPVHPKSATPARRAVGVAPQVVEIRAQAPVPQVVTVRPRVLPTFRADALDTTFIDRGFESALRTPYSIVPPPLPSPPSGAPTPVAPAPTTSSSPQHAPPQER